MLITALIMQDIMKDNIDKYVSCGVTIIMIILAIPHTVIINIMPIIT